MSRKTVTTITVHCDVCGCIILDFEDTFRIEVRKQGPLTPAKVYEDVCPDCAHLGRTPESY